MWWSEDEWASRCDAGRCGMCADAHLASNERSALVAATPTSFVRLARNQAHPGYSLVVLREYVTDLADLDADRLGAFWRDVQSAGRAIGAAFRPRKIDYLVMEHRMPHLHCHLLPQHGTDDPLRNVGIADGPVFLAPGEFAASLESLRRAWAAGGTA